MIVSRKAVAPLLAAAKTPSLRGRDPAGLIAATVLVFVGFGVASAVLPGHIHGAPWVTVLVLAGALFFAR